LLLAQCAQTVLKVKLAALLPAALTIGCELRQKICELPRGEKETIFFTAMDRKKISERFCYSCLHRLELLRKAQEKDGNSGHSLTGKQPAAIEIHH